MADLDGNISSNSKLTSNKSVTVAIIGGGLSGAALAYCLRKHNIQNHLFDTGKRSLGGRCSSRVYVPFDFSNEKEVSHKNKEANVIIDHSCQFLGGELQILEKKFPHIKALFEELKKNKVIEDFNQDVELRTFDFASGTWKENVKSNEKENKELYVGTLEYGGIGGIAPWLAGVPNSLCGKSSTHRSSTKVFQNQWVNDIQFDRAENVWRIGHKKGRKNNTNWLNNGSCYTHVVIAHSGKCATRLVDNILRDSSGGDDYLKSIVYSLRCRFIPGYGTNPDSQNQRNSDSIMTMKPPADKLDILSVFVLVVELKLPLLIQRGDENGALVLPTAVSFENSEVLTLASNNTKKYQGDKGNNATSNDSIWTLLSTSQFANSNKCPQEAIPQETLEKVSSEMIESFRNFLVAAFNSEPQKFKNNCNDRRQIQIKNLHLQLWGAALPANKVKNVKDGFLYSDKWKLGVVGDWLLGASGEAAMCSGLAFGEFLANVLMEKQKFLNSNNSSLNILQKKEPPDRIRFSKISSSGKTGFIAVPCVNEFEDNNSID